MRLLFLFCTLIGLQAANPDIEFAGPAPGKAQSQTQGDVVTLENNVLSASWEVRRGRLQPTTIVDKTTGAKVDQRGAELFRLSTTPVATGDGTYQVEINLEEARVVVRAGPNGKSMQEIATFPRADFPGEPKLVRVGKMNLKAQSKDHSGEAGQVGAGGILEINPAPAGQTGFTFRSAANRAATNEFAWPAGTPSLTARIDRGTDTALSWSPAVALIWEDGQRFLLVGVRDKRGTFNVTTAAGERMTSPKFTPFPAGDLPASAFGVVGEVRRVPLKDGQALEADLTSTRGVKARWRAELRDGSHYFRQTILLSAADQPFALHGVEFTDVRLPGLKQVGSSPGSPLAGAGFFAGVEMPGSANLVAAAGARTAFGCSLTLSAEQSYDFGAVTGLAPTGQVRRSFLRYVERERARPSSPFLHYNCWYDLGFGVDEPKMLEVVQAFDTELVKKRGVPVLSYLVDDGWDQPAKGLWVEHPRKFPGGFPATKAKMAAFGANLGIWISPLGGYGGDKERTAHAQKMGLIPPDAKLDLSYPKYRQWFVDRCRELMRTGGVNSFKWDRAGDGVSPHFMALLDVARQLRRDNPAVFINVTVGTWPSPFWLNHVDSTWRMHSADVGWTGKGDDREKWLTFRDGYCHKMFVQAAPLYPLNSAMHHGVVHGRAFQGDKVGKAGNDLKNEVRSYFANGASLQELYLTPSMMTATAWDHVAASAKWAHAHADVLRDAHWVGGDPLKLEPYGYAAWNPRQATLMLRNPDDQPRTIELDADEVFDLPRATRTATPAFDLRSPYADQRLRELKLAAGTKVTVTLQPFEVLVFDTDSAR
ncbi:MAG: hypothetical protein EBR70_03565 [Verrucomicrobia bacterium]|nr:hypothetical protein [Verrucomicrobiota bacterium]